MDLSPAKKTGLADPDCSTMLLMGPTAQPSSLKLLTTLLHRCGTIDEKGSNPVQGLFRYALSSSNMAPRTSHYCLPFAKIVLLASLPHNKDQDLAVTRSPPSFYSYLDLLSHTNLQSFLVRRDIQSECQQGKWRLIRLLPKLCTHSCTCDTTTN